MGQAAERRDVTTYIDLSTVKSGTFPGSLVVLRLHTVVPSAASIGPRDGGAVGIRGWSSLLVCGRAVVKVGRGLGGSGALKAMDVLFLCLLSVLSYGRVYSFVLGRGFRVSLDF